MKVNEAPAGKIFTIYDVQVNVPKFGLFHFQALVGTFANDYKGGFRAFTTTKEMDFKGDAPNIMPGETIWLRNAPGT